MWWAYAFCGAVLLAYGCMLQADPRLQSLHLQGDVIIHWVCAVIHLQQSGTCLLT